MVPEIVKTYVNKINKKTEQLDEYKDILNVKAKEFFDFVDREQFNDLLNPFITKLFEKHVDAKGWRTSQGDLLKVIKGTLKFRRYRCHNFETVNVICGWGKKQLDDMVYYFIQEFEPELLDLIKDFISIIEDIDIIKEPDREIVLTKVIPGPFEYVKWGWRGVDIKTKSEHDISLRLVSYNNTWDKKLEYVKEFSSVDSDYGGLFLYDEVYDGYVEIYSKAIEYYEALIKDVHKVKNRAINILLGSKYGPEFTALQI